MYIHRDMMPLLGRALARMPVVVLSGPRQAGKSTLLQHESALRGRRYYSLDDTAVLARALREPEALVEGDEPVIIDEVQRAPQLLLAIKRAVDRRRILGQFLLSGSANFLLLRNLAESLAGRAVYLHLGPLTWRERMKVAGDPFLVALLKSPLARGELPKPGKKVRNPVAADWLVGGFPAVCLGSDEETWRLWFTGYRQTYLERDLRDFARIADLGHFDHFTQLMALRSAQVLNLHDVARDCGSSATVMGRWIRLLEAGFLGQRLPPWFSSRVKRLVKAPKWYLNDSGLMAFLCGLNPKTVLEAHPLRGPIFETFLVQNIAALMGNHLPEAKLLHYRSHSGHEVDVVIETPQALVAVEAKAGAAVDLRDLRGLSAFLAAEPHCRAGIVAYTGQEIRPLGPRMWAVPVGQVLS